MNDPITNLTNNTDCISLGEFVGKLCKWAGNYIDEVAERIAKHATELYENKAIVYMVNEWEHYRSIYERDRANHLWRLAHGEPSLYEPDGHAESKAHHYDSVLYDMLVRSR